MGDDRLLLLAAHYFILNLIVMLNFPSMGKTAQKYSKARLYRKIYYAYFKNDVEIFSKFQKIIQNITMKNYVIYAGDVTEERSPGTMVDWKSFGSFLDMMASSQL
jgi:hypothetical protein